MPIDEVIFYNHAKGYGFIRAAPCNVFFHSSAIEGKPVKAGDTVKYEALPDGRNTPRARCVRVVDADIVAEIDRVFGPS